MNTIPLVKGNTQEEINTSLIALKKALDEMNSSSSKTDASVQSQIKQINELITNINSHLDTIDGQITDLQPVDSVTSGNMQSVTSNAVAISLKEKLNKEYWTLFSDWAPASEQVMNTYNNQKFSDYSILIFVIGSNDINTRNTVVLPREVFEDINGSIYIFAHGSNQIVEVDIKYNDDTSIKIQQDVASGNPFTPYIRIYGI